MKKWILVVFVILISGCSTGAQLNPSYSFRVYTEVVEPINGRETRVEVFENDVSICVWGLLHYEIAEGKNPFYVVKCNDDAPNISMELDTSSKIAKVRIDSSLFEVDIFKK